MQEEMHAEYIKGQTLEVICLDDQGDGRILLLVELI
jgi:hypothetical protein